MACKRIKQSNLRISRAGDKKIISCKSPWTDTSIHLRESGKLTNECKKTALVVLLSGWDTCLPQREVK